MINNVVLHFKDRVIRKGTTEDFFPNKPTFHFNDLERGDTRVIPVSSLKAIYFVKSFDGQPEYDERSDVERAGFGRRIRICFSDGEVQEGYTQGYSPGRPGFFVSPCDPDCNNERIFVISDAAEKIEFV